DPERELDLLARYEISTFCAPPTEYRLLVKQDLSRWRLPRLRHCTGAGEPLNPEVIHTWHERFGVMIHDGYGQTESIILAANLPALPIRPGSMGKPFPGHDVRVLGGEGGGRPGAEGRGAPGARGRGRGGGGGPPAGGRGGRPGRAREAAVALPGVLEEP